MLNRAELPDTDLNRLRAEILSGPLESALPANMTEEWLNLIARDIYEALSDDAPTTKNPQVRRTEAPLQLILRLLNQGKAWHVTDLDALPDLFQNYLAEIVLELVRRQKGHWIEPATVETILTRTELTLEQALYGVSNVRYE